MGDDRFFEELPIFDDFHDLSLPDPFRPLPRTWKIILADVEHSTEIIQSGRYRDVNTLGAACIEAAQRAMPKRAFPFVFGGDGIALAVPASAEAAVKKALMGVRLLGVNRFGITLHLGMIGAEELAASGFCVEVGRFRLVGRCAIALFRGGGMTEAERRMKNDPGRYGMWNVAASSVNLKNVSCRWLPIPSERGSVLSIIVWARSDDGYATYREVLQELDGILGGDLSNANPVHLSTMKYHSFSEILASERRLHKGPFSFGYVNRLVEIFASVLIFRWGIPPIVFDARKYAASMSVHSDYRKFDDGLRLVLDCSPTQRDAIRTFLERMLSEGRIFFGLHESKEALMTCVVPGLRDGEHIHFVDGGAGGYALAAVEFKRQRKEADEAAGQNDRIT